MDSDERAPLLVSEAGCKESLCVRKNCRYMLRCMTEAAKCLNGRNASLNAVDCSRREMRGCTTDLVSLVWQRVFPKTTTDNDASPSTNPASENDHSPLILLLRRGSIIHVR